MPDEPQVTHKPLKIRAILRYSSYFYGVKQPSKTYKHKKSILPQGLLRSQRTYHDKPTKMGQVLKMKTQVGYTSCQCFWGERKRFHFSWLLTPFSIPESLVEALLLPATFKRRFAEVEPARADPKETESCKLVLPTSSEWGNTAGTEVTVPVHHS